MPFPRPWKARPSQLPFRTPARGFPLAAVLASVVFFAAPVGAQEEVDYPPLLKTSRSITQAIPLSTYFLGDEKAEVKDIRMQWDRNQGASGDIGDDILSFRFEDAKNIPTLGLLRSQFWISALSSAFAWQEPWSRARWTVSEIPEVDGTAVGLSLAIGMVGTASEVKFPDEVIVIGSLNPDGGIGSVSALGERIKAAGAAGKKTVVLPNVQRFEMMPDGALRNIEEFARENGLDVIFVTDIVDATEKVLKHDLPPQPMVASTPAIEGPLFSYLSDLAKKEREPLSASEKDWPRAPASYNRLRPELRSLWQDVFKSYADGSDALTAGLLYVSWLKFIEANAKIRAIEAFENDPDMTHKELEGQANLLRQKINESMDQPGIDRDELQSALVLAEKADTLYAVNARLEGSQIFARQAFGPRSAASKKEKKLALQRLFGAVQETDYWITAVAAYDGMVDKINQGKKKEVYGRAKLWIPQLVPTYLGAAELFTLGLKQNSNRIGKMGLLDPYLATYARVLRDAKSQWEAERRKSMPVTSAEATKETIDAIGFKPGDAFQPPKAPVPPAPPRALSDVARCLIWVNDYCELETLNLKYLKLNGFFDKKTQNWEIPRRAILQQMVQFGDLAARRGIAFAREVGVDPSIIAMIYTRANYLRNSQHTDDRLESLRQFWRCTMLGNMCWQLGYVPRARATPVTVEQEAPAEEAPQESSAEPDQPAPAPVPQAVPPPQPTPAPQPEPAPSAPPRAQPAFPVGDGDSTNPI